MTKRNYVDVVVSAGQYEQSTCVVKVSYTTSFGLIRRLKQLSREYAVYGDNWERFRINANISIADKDDVYSDNSIIGGQWCEPENGWLDFSDYSVLRCQLKNSGIII